MFTERNKRIARNTMMLYTRQILIIGISLYTVRLTLQVLGVEDYGLYTVVGGVVALLTFMSASMSSATQRFFSFALGRKDSELLSKTFTITCVIYVGIAVISILLFQTIGLWFIQSGLKVPVEREDAVYWVYQFSVFTFAASILRAPFAAIVIAHEDMQYTAIFSVAEAVVKLLSVIVLMHLPYDKLVGYSAFLFAIALLHVVAYFAVCLVKYEECQFRSFNWDRKLAREVCGFTGWTLFGQITNVGRMHGITILLNQYFNPVVVAAKAISSSVRTQVNMFANNFNIGLYPPIVKAYAEGQQKEMLSLVSNGSKITFFLLWVFALPLFLEMELVLRLWLGELPPHVVLFTRLALIDSLFLATSHPVATAARAPGRMMGYELTLGIIQICIFIASWVALNLGAEAYAVYVISIIANILMFFVRLYIVKGLVGLQIPLFIKSCVIPVAAVAGLSGGFSWAVHCLSPDGYLGSGLTIAFSVLFSCLCMYYLGLSRAWRQKVLTTISSRINLRMKRFVI